jgi:histidine ammonia-lyase
MPMQHTISNEKLNFDALSKIAFTESVTLTLSTNSKNAIDACRNYLNEKVKSASEPIYGINTGFGSLYNRNISAHQLEKLQENLVKSHACGTGAEVPEDIVKLMLFLKIQSLSYGNSGVQSDTVERLIAFFNHQVYPVVYQQGSLGASGDLAPLAHLSLPLINEGLVYHQHKIKAAKEVNAQFNWQPLHLQSKEGLALLNGTQFMSAYGLYAVLHAKRLLSIANLIGALSLDAFDGRIEAFDNKLQQVRPHNGQIFVANAIRTILKGSELIVQKKKHVQDPYSFRCIPQVHGASMQAIEHVSDVILQECNAVTDNPIIFPKEDEIISGGNFHGQLLALPMDYLALALSELGNISERRTYQLISGSRDLPHYLVANPGINSGMMIPQYTAASIVSQNKQLCTPASADSIVSSNGQEDHVSMGANAATKLYTVVDNVYTILAIELFTAAQAMQFRRPLKTSPILEEWLGNFREKVTFLQEDRLLHNDILASKTFLKNSKLPEL